MNIYIDGYKMNKKIILDEDFKEEHKNYHFYVVKSNNGNSYVIMRDDIGKTYHVASYIMKLHNNSKKVFFKDGNILNCKKENLYIEEKAKEYRERKPLFWKKFKGVHKNRKKYNACICLNNKKLYIGSFEEEKDAAQKRDAILDYLNLNGYRNFPDSKYSLTLEEKKKIDEWIKLR